MKFRVDIGEDYDQGGRVVEVTAPNARAAFEVAKWECKGDEIIQQIFDEKMHCYYDFMNGFALYEQSA